METIARTFADAGVRYLFAGGLAVVAHGYLRFTADVDLILDLEEENLRLALPALAALGYRPRAPVELEDFADERRRQGWIREKGMKVFSLFSDRQPLTEVDIFVECPLDFARAWDRRLETEAAPGIVARFLGLDDLLDLKRRAGRPQDLADIRQLEELSREEEG